MRWRRKIIRLCLLLLLLSLGGLPASAAPPAGAGAAPPSAAPGAPPLPDYGGRDGGAGDAGGPGDVAPLNPLAQAWRALEALAIVLAGVVGVLYLLRRAGLVRGEAPGAGGGRTLVPSALRKLLPPPAPPAAGPPGTGGTPVTVVSSQALPGAGGATLHLVTVADRSLLLGATAQSVALLAEWETEATGETPESPAEAAAFDAYLTRAGIAPPVTPARAAETRIAAAADRLQSLLAHSRAESSEEIS